MTIFEVVKADITTLENVEAIINASHESGLGCHIPNHCIDNVIHTKAGPKLKEECAKFNGIPTGVPKITNAYDLPCKYVIHVTGPRAHESKPLEFDVLANCYTSCLDLAVLHKISTIAFCCVSTGQFGYPKRESAGVAVEACRSWTKSHAYKFERIVFCVWTWEDLHAYSNVLDGL